VNCFSHPEIDERLSHPEQIEAMRAIRRNRVFEWAARTRALLDEKKPASGPTDAGQPKTDSEAPSVTHTLP